MALPGALFLVEDVTGGLANSCGEKQLGLRAAWLSLV
jgi:hypothetical protein